MTAPVVFRPSADDKGWQVSFYCPSKFDTMEAIPVPKNENIKIMTLGPATYAVRVFSGFATHWDFVTEEVSQSISLGWDRLGVISRILDRAV